MTLEQMTPVPILQRAEEFDVLLEMYREREPTRVLEIGTYHGGTLYHWLRHAQPGTLVVSVDSYATDVDNRALYEDWRPPNVKLAVVEGDSRDPEVVRLIASGAPYDWVFIDAGHFYDEVKADWMNYGPMCSGLVCFHDILYSHVARLWGEIKADHETLELVSDPTTEWHGIGCVFMSLTDIYTPAFFAEHHETTALSASVVAPLVKDLLAPESVLDIGCGQGEWLEAFGLEDSFGVDIAAPEREGFLRHDLAAPLDLERTFDLVISLETAEHLPESAADTYVESIARHGDTVLFSAAVPGQIGLHHVNCQPHEYWHEKFAQHGFAVGDPIRPLIADNHHVSPWYRENIYLYSRP